MSQVQDPAFANAGRAPGVEIWRIENLKPVPYPKKLYGKFYKGDSYIVLNTKQRPSSNAFDYNLHFWLGSESSQDEQGVTAYKTVELDTLLGDTPVQYREVEGHESDQFLSMFKNRSVEYLEGGVKSGFKSAAEEKKKLEQPRLLQLKGKNNVRITQVPISADSLNGGDVFVLDHPESKTIWQWNGASANKKEKAKALDITADLMGERGGSFKTKVIVLDQGNDNDETFWKILGGRKKIKEATDDEAAEAAMVQASVLYRISDESGKVLMTQEAEGKELSQEMLDPKDCFILDCGAEVFVWVGTKTTIEEKKACMTLGTSFVTQTGRPIWTRVTKVIEGHESTWFKSKFSSWKNPPPPDFRQQSKGNIAQVKKTQFSAASMIMPVERPKDVLPDDGTGKIQIWRIKSFGTEDVPQSQYGQFFGGDSYIVLYTYLKGRSEEYIIYFWQGRDSSQDEKAAAALWAKNKDDELGGKPVQVRVEMNKEPPHFMTIFKGRMIVHKGGTASGFKNRTSSQEVEGPVGVHLYHVRGYSPETIHGVEVDPVSSNLSSGDVFILVGTDTVFVWCGSDSSPDEKSVAIKLAGLVKGNKPIKEVLEGEETTKFWNTFVGGKKPYPKTKFVCDSPHEPRLFHCSNVTGNFKADEIVGFSQDDLLEEDVFILDTYTEVFLWIGAQCNESEKQEATRAAEEYIKLITDGAPRGCVVIVNSGNEPPNFTCHFHAWDDSKAQKGKFEDPYEKKLSQIRSAGSVEQAAPAPSSGGMLQKFGLKKPDAKPTSGPGVKSPPGPAAKSPPTAAASGQKDSSGGLFGFALKKTPNSVVDKEVGEISNRFTAVVKSEPPKLPTSTSSGAAQFGKSPSLKAKVPPEAPQKRAPTPPPPDPHGSSSSNFLDPQRHSFPYDQLDTRKNQHPPQGVDPGRREAYLSDAEFVKVMKKPKAEFYKQPGWKQVNGKKEAFLF